MRWCPFLLEGPAKDLQLSATLTRGGEHSPDTTRVGNRRQDSRSHAIVSGRT